MCVGPVRSRDDGHHHLQSAAGGCLKGSPEKHRTCSDRRPAGEKPLLHVTANRRRSWHAQRRGLHSALPLRPPPPPHLPSHRRHLRPLPGGVPGTLWGLQHRLPAGRLSDPHREPLHLRQRLRYTSVRRRHRAVRRRVQELPQQLRRAGRLPVLGQRQRGRARLLRHQPVVQGHLPLHLWLLRLRLRARQHLPRSADRLPPVPLPGPVRQPLPAGRVPRRGQQPSSDGGGPALGHGAGQQRGLPALLGRAGGHGLGTAADGLRRQLCIADHNGAQQDPGEGQQQRQ
mmetsp:Transcript_35154/g.77483  ORF Transcript_35154/g.77483 Transcript_35154/m.77483 type:complete len:286 (+) Transcript_35154:3154-4011(+)